MRKILCIILAFSCMLCLFACSADNTVVENKPSKKQEIMQTEPTPKIPDICGAWITNVANKILILNDNSGGVYISLGETEHMPFYNVHIVEFYWKNDQDDIFIRIINDDGSLDDEEKYSYETNNSELFSPELLDEWPLTKMVSTGKTEETFVGDWKAYNTNDAFISFRADGSWYFATGTHFDGITEGKYSINSNGSTYYTEATLCDDEGHSFGYVRLLGNGFLEFYDGGHRWLLEY